MAEYDEGNIMEEFLHTLIHLIGDMVKDMQDHEKKICELIDKHVKETEGKDND